MHRYMYECEDACKHVYIMILNWISAVKCRYIMEVASLASHTLRRNRKGLVALLSCPHSRNLM